MNEVLKAEIDRKLETLHALQSIVPSSGMIQQARVSEEMNELISAAYEPYFCGNAALHLLSSCRRCGRCCRDEMSIAVSIDDCRKIAKHLNMSLKRFNIEYTRPHTQLSPEVGSARLIRKEEGETCPFYDSRLPGCGIHQAKPQVCSAAFYLSKMNLLLCRENKQFSTFPRCPSDVALRVSIKDFQEKIRADPEAMNWLARTFRSSLPDIQLFHLLLRLKGMEIYFGREKAALLARKMGLKRMPNDEELKPAALLYVVTLMVAEKED